MNYKSWSCCHNLPYKWRACSAHQVSIQPALCHRSPPYKSPWYRESKDPIKQAAKRRTNLPWCQEPCSKLCSSLLPVPAELAVSLPVSHQIRMFRQLLEEILKTQFWLDKIQIYFPRQHPTLLWTKSTLACTGVRLSPSALFHKKATLVTLLSGKS